MKCSNLFRIYKRTYPFLFRVFSLAFGVTSAEPAESETSRPVHIASPAPGLSQRIVSLGAGVTESLFALGAGREIVAVDTSSEYPAETKLLPKVGYYRQLVPETILAHRPTRIVASDEAGPPSALAHLRAAGIDVFLLSTPKSARDALLRLLELGRALEREPEALALVATLEQRLDRVKQRRRERNFVQAPRVLCLLQPTAGLLFVSGRDTSCDSVIRLAGGQNVIELSGWKTVGAEHLVRQRPDILLMTTRTARLLGGEHKWRELPGLDFHARGQPPAVLVMDDGKLLTFGPRFIEAVEELEAALTSCTPGDGCESARDPGTK